MGLPILLVVGVVAAILLARGGGEGSGSGSSSSSPLAVTVPGHESWVDTGIRVQAGATVRVTATGSVIHDNSTDPTLSSGPDGDTDRPDLRQFNVLSDVDHANLIGRIGTAGTPFVVGSELAFTADAAGRLFLGINDVGVFNNGGAYEARVSVRAP